MVEHIPTECTYLLHVENEGGRGVDPAPSRFDQKGPESPAEAA